MFKGGRVTMNISTVFKMPKVITITTRTSSITNAFVSGIIPCVYPTEDEIRENLNILGLDYLDLRCSYCGDKCTEWDHLRPILKDKRPTGYISDIYNLVPSCSKCNQSKENQEWYEWIIGDSKQSPKTRKIENLDNKIKRLEDFQNWRNVQPIKFEELVQEKIWETHWENCEKIHSIMKECKKHALIVKKQIEDNYK